MKKAIVLFVCSDRQDTWFATELRRKNAELQMIPAALQTAS